MTGPLCLYESRESCDVNGMGSHVGSTQRLNVTVVKIRVCIISTNVETVSHHCTAVPPSG